MPSQTDLDFESGMAELCHSFVVSLGPRRRRLLEVLASVRADVWSETLRDEVRFIAHKLAGAGTSFGFRDLSTAAMALEDRLIDHPRAGGAAFVVDIETLIDVCESAAVEGGLGVGLEPTRPDLI